MKPREGVVDDTTQTRRLPDAAGPRIQQLGRGSGMNLAGAVVSALSIFLTTGLVSRSLPLAQAGMVLVPMATIALAARVMMLGSEAGLGRYSQLERLSVRGVRRVAAMGIVPPLIISSLVAALVASAGQPIASTLGIDPPTSLRMLLALSLPVVTAVELMLTATRSLGSMRAALDATIVRSVVQPGLMATAIVAVPPTATILLAAWLSGYLVILPLLVRRYLRATRGYPETGAVGPGARAYWVYCAPRTVATSLQAAIDRLDIILLTALISTEAGAIYTVASRYAFLALMPAVAALQASMPRMAQAFAHGRTAQAGRALRSASVLGTLGAVPVCLTLALYGSSAMAIFGEQYRVGATALAWVMVGVALSVSAGPVDAALLMAGNSRRSLVNVACAFVVNVGLNLVLIPRIGLVGAALAWSAALLVHNLLSVIAIRHYGVKPGARLLWRLWMIGVATFAFGLGVGTVLLPAGLARAVVGAGLGVAGYLAATLRLRAPIIATVRGDAAPPGGAAGAQWRAAPSRSVPDADAAGHRQPGRVGAADGTTVPGAAISIVIPAHNEADVIERCLRTMLTGARPGELEVVVAANGCTDDTAAIARRVAPAATVLNLPKASKIAALNAGDAAATVFPRAYVDADIEVDVASLRAGAAALDDPVIECVAPTIQLQLDGRPWFVRRFYDCFLRLPYLADDLVGQGFYMLSAAGRARFDRFPDITADDLFIRNLFPRGRRRAVPDAAFRVHAPRTLGGLLAVRRRTYRGNAEYDARGFLAAAESTARADRFVAQLRHRPLSFAVYVAVNLLARAQLRLGRRRPRWERDDSSRQPA